MKISSSDDNELTILFPQLRSLGVEELRKCKGLSRDGRRMRMSRSG